MSDHVHCIICKGAYIQDEDDMGFCSQGCADKYWREMDRMMEPESEKPTVPEAVRDDK
jgi:predicted nucleic acid-binding Zn ribbon protein